MARDRVLIRLTDGRFRAVAGNGRSGFSGDCGSALRAELSTVSGLAFSPLGSLFVVDGGRIRVIHPDGIIDTIAGDGRTAGHITAGTPARSAALGTAGENAGPSIAVSPGGALYVATARQVLRLTAHGTPWPVRDVATTGPVHGSLDGLGDIAVDGRGDIDVSGVNGWSVWQITRHGHAHEVGPDSGFEAHQQLVARRDGHITLLWQEGDLAGHDRRAVSDRRPRQLRGARRRRRSR